MVNKDLLEKYSATTSFERIAAFVEFKNDSEDIIIDRYNKNIKISQALYPELSVLEITLRNAIDTMFKIQFGNNWIEDEINSNKLLDIYDYNTLLKAYTDVKNECANKLKPFSIGKVIANLSFGFWTNLCLKKYNAKIWTKKGVFKGIFANYPKEKQQQIHAISNLLNSIRKLRNRVFHYEIILKEPQNLLKKYNEILEMLSYLPQNNPKILNETSNFLKTFDEVTASNKAKT